MTMRTQNLLEVKATIRFYHFQDFIVYIGNSNKKGGEK